MDAFLSKPVRIDHIENLLLQRFGTRALACMEPATPTCETPVPVVAAPENAPRRRFRSGDVAQHLDMAMLGEICVAVSLTGYRSLLDGFFCDESGGFAALVAALDRGDLDSLHASAHALKGAAACLGLHALASLASQTEHGGTRYCPEDCAATSLQLVALRHTAHALCHRMGLTAQTPVDAVAMRN